MSSLIFSRSSLILRSLSSRIEQPQQHDGGVRFQGVSRVVYEAGSDGYAEGPSDLTLLPRFGGHMACRICVDVDVSIF